jgi:serine/threonine protein kinase
LFCVIDMLSAVGMTEDGPGLINGRFRCTRRLGAGAFGSVWLAADEASNDVQVAVKLLHSKHTTDEEVVVRFKREADILSKLDHPAIARALAWDVTCETPFLAMEYVHGPGLDVAITAHLEHGTFFAREEIIRIADELCGAVGYAHAQQVVHRDLKPKNIIVLPRAGRIFIKVLDFGIAKMLASEADKTATGRMMGSLLYMAPEQITGAKVTHLVDVFALGTIFFELLTLRNPWARDAEGRPIPARLVSTTPSEVNSDYTAMNRIVKEARPVASTSRAELPPEIDAVLAKAMAIDAHARHQSADELIDDLKRAIPSWTRRSVPSREVSDIDNEAQRKLAEGSEGRLGSRGSGGISASKGSGGTRGSGGSSGSIGRSRGGTNRGSATKPPLPAPPPQIIDTRRGVDLLASVDEELIENETPGRRWPLMIALLALFAVLGAGGFILWQQTRGPIIVVVPDEPRK